VHWGELNSGKYNMLLPVNNLFKYNEQLEYPITYPRELRDHLNISEIAKARRYYKFKDLDVDMYLQDKEDLYHYKKDKLTKELTNIQKYLRKYRMEKIILSIYIK
jgi:Zn-dependent peptidase ImmA (M78 family)